MTWIKASALSVALIFCLGSEAFAGVGLAARCQGIIASAKELRYTWRTTAARGGRAKQILIGPLAGISHLV